MSTPNKTKVILITDIGSVDLDDTFALMILAQLETQANLDLSVITTQYYSKERALMAKLILTELGSSHVPVYANADLPYNPQAQFDQKLRSEFDLRHQLWPGEKFGYPHGCRKDGEKDWFPGFMQSFREHYSQTHLNAIADQVEKVSGFDYLVSTLSKPSAHKIKVICIGPNDIFQNLPWECHLNATIWSMGGGYTKVGYDKDDCHKADYGNSPLLIEKCNYNWGVSTASTNILLTTLTFCEMQMNVVSSHIVKAFNSQIPDVVYQRWKDLAHQSKHPLLKSIMKDWSMSIQSHYDKTKAEKTMSDPLTVMLAIFPHKYNLDTIPCDVSITDQTHSHYQEIIPNHQIVNIKFQGQWDVRPNVNLIDDFDPAVVTDMIGIIDQTLLTLVS